MATFKISHADVPRLFAEHAKKMPEAIDKGCLKAAHRARSVLVRVSPVYLGQFKNSWRVVGLGRGKHAGYAVMNDAPHAGIIERGARPHKVSNEGIAALTKWAKRKILTGLSRAKYMAQTGRTAAKSRRATKTRWAESWADREAEKIAWAIAKKIEKEGQKGKFIVEQRLWTFSQYLAQEVGRSLAKALRGKWGGP